MALSSAGIGSNLDVDGIVSKLMSVERQPLTKLARQEASYQTKLSGFGTLKGALTSFQTSVRNLSDISKFQGLKVSAADATVVTASATAAAVPGTYALNVTQLAQAQKLVAGGVVSDIAPVGKGVITFDFGTIAGGAYDAVTGKYTGSTFTTAGSGVKTVTIDSTNDSLSGIRDAINKAAIGVTATIVNDGSGTPYRLSLSSSTTGAAASMKISVANTAPDTGLGTLLNHNPAGSQALVQKSTAQNAEFTVDGIAVSKPANIASDVIGGVTLNLLKTTTTPTTISIARDTAAVTTAVNDFVKAYNEISKNFVDATAYNASTKTAAILNGEASVRGMQAQVRAVLTAPITGGASAFSRLSEIGVAVQKDGSLAVDATKLGNAITNNFSDFAGLFASVGKSSDSLVGYKGFTSATKPGAYALDVSQLATKGSATGTAAVTGTALVIGAGNDTLEVLLNGVSSTIQLTQKTYASAADLAAEVQSKINGAPLFSAAGSAVAVSAPGGILSMTSNKYGSASTVSITGGSGQANLNFVASGATVVTGLDVAGTVNGMPATGNGQVLTSSSGDSAGLALTVGGGAIGARGTVNYSQGYAHQFDTLATSILGTTGSLLARTDGISASIKGLGKSQEALLARLAVVEKRYRAQFTALDLTISSMNTTSNFLTQQLAQFANLASQ
ncbi:flagellar hook protein FliD [Massilia eurypsychrophila]|uniref:Flagellar hook-associated protein 2 n=1 Tax=Massilia eurypsychrophila TaxID=1485217 RepID=A0A2G8TBM6_9BURK|nr:flagellar filament capping protein FliD [Massilia eurypsychrophila]PIL43383.1 flagellar hook protein FliD [Massilia eurypsychrophila]